MRLPSLAAAGLLWLAAATAPFAAEPAPDTGQRFLEELERLQAEGDPLRRELEELAKSFTPDADFLPIKARHDRALGGLVDVSERVRDLEFRFTAHIKRSLSAVLVDGMAVYTGAAGRKPSASTLQRAGDAIVDEDIKTTIRSYRRAVGQDVAAAQNRFVEFERSWHQRRQLRGVFLAMGVLVAAFLAVGAWLARRKPQVITLSPYATPLPEAAALSGPAPAALLPQAFPTAPGALSGPAAGTDRGAVGVGNVLGGNYRVERELGRGGMGLVYEATDLTLGRKVAIKRMREEISAHRRELDMFLAEARLVAQLKHPNLVAIHHILQDGPVLYLVFEHVAGRPLSAALEESERLPFEEARRVVRDVGSGLDYAHANKVIHRDLKPSNIMLADDGSVKVMDFGIAHQAKKTVARVTKADAWGTPPYMSPEQELGTVSRESDLYSLTICLYEMATGRLPFEGPNYLAQKREMAFERPSSVASGLPPGFDEVVSRGLEAEAARRFHSAAELSAALDALTASKTGPA